MIGAWKDPMSFIVNLPVDNGKLLKSMLYEHGPSLFARYLSKINVTNQLQETTRPRICHLRSIRD